MGQSMDGAAEHCRSCDTPLPVGAAFCPACGTATPTEVNQATGEMRHAAGRMAEAEQRARLQRIVGSQYRVEELIGQGGFGAVFAARDLTLDREVAIKALRPDLVTVPALIERFKREARAAAQLRHPNIMPIYLVGGGEDTAFMVMPRIAGESLKALMERKGRLPIEDVRRILIEAGRALAQAHASELVHRDVKPENILLEGKQRHVYLTDFGIAKAIGKTDEGLTATGTVVGTPSYMSPEQAGGQPSIDHRSDIYSLGVVGFQMLTGQLPYSAESLNELIFQQITREAPPLRSLRPEVPEFLAAAIDRCLRRDPEERWLSADELVRAVSDEAYVSPSARPAVRRRWQPAAIGIGVVAVGVAVVAVVTKGAPASDQLATDTLTTVATQAQPTQPPPDTAVAARPGTPIQPPPPTVTEAEPRRTAAAQQPPAERPAVGYLTVDADPWGLVQVDGVDVKETPLTAHTIPPGVHVIRVLRDGYLPVVDTVTITAGNLLRRRYSLERRQ